MKVKGKGHKIHSLNDKHLTSKLSSKKLKNYRKNRKRSSLELLVYQWLDELKIKYIKEKTIGKCHADIVICENIVIELQGCYFHTCPKCYPNPINDMQKFAPIKDSKRFAFFKSKGFKVNEIWECDVNKNPESIKIKLKELYNSAKST